jgi:hypothetical protein
LAGLGLALAACAPPPAQTTQAQQAPAETEGAENGTESESQEGEIVDITLQGAVSASSFFEGFPAELAADGDFGTSWFSNEADGAVYTWTAFEDELIVGIHISNNELNLSEGLRTGFGFESLTVQVLDASNGVVHEDTISLEGTPDPDISLSPNVIGRSIQLRFEGPEAADRGGFSELSIEGIRAVEETAIQYINATSEGTVSASSSFEGFAPELAIDGDQTTSWFSNGPEAGTQPTAFTWESEQEELITGVYLFNNELNADPTFESSYGFERATIQVLDSEGEVVFEEEVDLAGTPDPDIVVFPNVRGMLVMILLFEHESPERGGFSELLIEVGR